MARRRNAGCGVLLVGALALAVLPFTSCSTQNATRSPRAMPSTATPSEGPRGQGDGMARREAPSTAVMAELESLPVKGRAAMTGYSREAFGPDWADVNGNGCDTRNDVLRRDLVDTQVSDCVVQSGVLHDPYSGDTVAFTRGPVTSMDVQIDHVVSLANAWQTGAAYWSPAKRERFANDPRNLLAVRGDLNLQKGDGDAATWLPPRKAFRCRYVSSQVRVKAAYGLWVTPAEKAAMVRVLDACQGEP